MMILINEGETRSFSDRRRANDPCAWDQSRGRFK